MPDFDFVGAAYVAPSIYQDDQECINWYPEMGALKKPGERGVVALYPTPGLFLRSIIGTAPIRGMWVQPGGARLFVVSGSAFWVIQSTFYGIPVGTLATVTGPVSMTDNGQEVYFADGVSRYSYNWSTGAFTVRGDGAFPSADRVDYIDNYVIYNNPNSNTWGCTDISSSTSSALNFGRKDSSSDNLVTLMAVKGEIYLLGERTGEVWVDGGRFPFPFQRLGGTSLQHGCAAKHSIARLGESIAWLSKDDRGTSMIFTLWGYFPQRISTHAIEHELGTYSTVADAIAFSYQQDGHEFYVLTFPTADKTWTYDLATRLWHKRASRTSDGVLHRHRSNCFALFQGMPLVGDYQNGKVYELSLTTYTDNGEILPCVRRCPHLTTDLRRQYFHDLQIQFQPGVGLAVGQGSDPQAMLKWSDDGGSTWSNEHWASIGQMGQYKNRAIWRRLGQARDRIFEVTVTDPVYRVIVSANVNASLGEN